MAEAILVNFAVQHSLPRERVVCLRDHPIVDIL